MNPQKPYDLLLQGGHVIDPANGRDALLDVAIADGRIAAVAPDLDATSAAQTIDVADHYVTPGLIDLHVHLHPDWYFGGIVPDAHSWSSGVTTMVDAGSPGGATFGEWKEKVVDKYRTRVLAFLNIVDWGMRGECEQDPRRMNPLVAAKVAEAYPEIIVGIKTAHYWTRQPWDEVHQPWIAIDRGVEAARLCGKPLMVDFWPRPERTYGELILEKLGPGDIHTHVFAQHFPIITAEGKVNPDLYAARERGVVFDLGHGGGSFWFRNAVPAIAQGFYPDSISTDLHIGNAANGLVVNLLHVMTKILNLGMSLQDVIQRVTVAPAHEISRPELGTLTVGAPADVAVLALRSGSYSWYDCGRAKFRGDKKLECAMTIGDGEIRYDPQGLSMPLWEEAPEPYWICSPPAAGHPIWRPRPNH